MIHVAKSAIRDHWSSWTESFVPAPVFDVNEYQQRLNDIAGLSNGKPILRLEWGGDATTVKYTEWDVTGTPSHAEIVPRYAIPRASEILSGIRYIPIRRWIITQRSEPEQHRPDDNFDNTFVDNRGVLCIAGRKEVEFYTPYIYIGDHTKCPDNCCETRLCLGDYKTPSRDELDYIRDITYRLKTEFYADPTKPLDSATMDKIRKEENEKYLKKSEELDKQFDEESLDWWRTHSHRITEDDPSVLSRGKYRHFYKDGKPV